MSRRRDMTPTIERKDAQVETMGKTLVKAQDTERKLKRIIRDLQRDNRDLAEQIAHVQRLSIEARDRADHGARMHSERIEHLQAELAHARRPFWQRAYERMRIWFNAVTE